MNGTRVSVGWLLVLVAAVTVGAGGTAVAGEPPLADAGLDQQVKQNATVLLDAAGSRDPDGTIRSYRWTIETPAGLTVRPADAGAARTSFVARHPGRYEVTVTVWDDDGYTASDTLYVDVAPSEGPQPPDGSGGAGVPQSEPPERTTAPTDPRTEPSEEPSTAGAAAAAMGTPDATQPTCPDGTRYVPTFDSCGASGDLPPTISIDGPSVVSPGSAHSFAAEASDFPDGIDRIEWAGGETGGMVLREFSEETGRRTLRATVYDGEGNSRTARHTVHVGTEDPPPEVEVDVSGSGCVGEQVTFEGTASARPGDQLERTWWAGPDPVFTPGEPGVYSRTLKASDDDGQMGIDTEQFRVEKCGSPNILKGTVPGPVETDKIVIMGTDTSLQATVETTNLTRRGYGEDAERKAGGGAAGVLADSVEGLRHIVRNGGETVAGQEEKNLKRIEANDSVAERAVLVADGEYGRINTNASGSPEQVLFEDDRALVNPTVVDGMERDADNYVIVVKQASRKDIADRLQNGREEVESDDPFESQDDDDVSAAKSAGSGARPDEMLDPIHSVGETAVDRATDNYNEALTFRDRLLDDGNSPADMAEIVGDRLVGEKVTESLGETFTGGPSKEESETSQSTSDSDHGSSHGADDHSSSDSTTDPTVDGPGGDGTSDGIVPNSVSETMQDLNPLSGGDSGGTDVGEDGGSTPSTSSSGSSSDDGQDSTSDLFGASLPDSVSSDTSSDSGSSSSTGESDSGGVTIDADDWGI